MATLQNVFIFILCVAKTFQERIMPSPPSITAGPKPYPKSSWNPELGDRIYVYIAKEKNTRLQCVASGNTPQLRYDWLKDGKLIDFMSNEVKYPNNTLRIYKEQGLGTLNIHRVQESDYGTYQCRASSDREDSQAVSLSKKVELIEAHISPFQDSSDVDSKKVPQGQYLMLTCDPPFSNPKATLSWTSDDTLREMDFNERIVMDYEGNLHFANVASEDGGDKMYSCFAALHFIGFYTKGRSTEFKVYGDKAMFQPAKIRWTSEKNVVGVEGEPVKFMCIFSGHPTPTISWRRVGRAIEESSGYELVISAVKPSDKGEYVCSGTNSVTERPQEFKFMLDVQAKPTWVSPPLDTRVSVGESGTVNCAAEGNPTPTVEWYIDGKPFKEIPGKCYIQNDVLHIDNLNKKESTVVQCNATNSHGSLFSDVYINVLAAPDPPDNVKLTICGDWKLGLLWSAGFHNYMPIINYTIEYSTSFDWDKWTTLYQTSDSNTQVSDVPLSAWVIYKFRIKALNQKGYSEPSEPTNTCQTDPKRPARHPTGVRVKDYKKDGFLYVEWEAISPMEHNGENFKYKLSVRNIADDNTKQYIVAGNKTSKEIETKDTYQKYGVRVAAENSVGAARGDPQEVFGYSGMGGKNGFS